MKKTRWMILLGLLLTLAMSVPSLAAGTGIALNDKVYTFYGSESTEGTYEVDGITFVIEENQVTIKQPGKPDEVHVLSYESLKDVVVVADKSASSAERSDEDAVVYSSIVMDSGNIVSGALAQAEEIVITQVIDDAAEFGDAELPDAATHVYTTQDGQSFTVQIASDNVYTGVVENQEGEMVEYTVSAMTTGNTEANPDYSAYAKYGLSFDSGEDTLYY